jgi:hypothetical protein
MQNRGFAEAWSFSVVFGVLPEWYFSSEFLLETPFIDVFRDGCNPSKDMS